MNEFDFSRCREYPFTPNEATVKGFHRRGEVVFYTGTNGMPYDQKGIELAGITQDMPLTVKRIHVGDWSSTYVFEEYPEHQFNTVCFASRKPVTPSVVTVAEQHVYVVSVDDHPTGVFASKVAVLDRFPDLKFEEITTGFWKAFSIDQYNTVYVERFLVQNG